MRELTVRIRFTKHSLGNVKDNATGRMCLPRNPQGFVLFLPTWHRSNLRMASQVLGKHQDEVEKVCWDLRVDGDVRRDPWFRRYYAMSGGKKRYALHEAFFPGQVVGLHCVVPAAIDDDDLRRLMQLAGQYRGLSPWRPGEFGLFEVDQILPRRMPQQDREGILTRDAERTIRAIEAETSEVLKHSGPD